MTRAVRLVAGCALALGLAATGHAQAPPVNSPPNKRCEAANKRVAREHKDVTATLDALGRERKARESCTSRSVCARLDANIATIEKKHQRHEVRLVRARSEVLEACRPAPPR